MGFIISIANNKGGCGKTTTTCNLADALGKKKKKVLVVDMDSQCNATSKLIPKNTPIRNSLYDLLDPDQKETDIKSFFCPTEHQRVYLIPNISSTGNLEPDLIMNAPNSFFKLRDSLREFAVKNYDFTLIDNPPNMGTFVLCSLYASDFVVVPVKAGSTDSVEGLLKATQLINDVKDKGNSDLRFLRILINSIDRRTAISKAIVEQIHQTFTQDQVFKTEIPINTAFEKAEAINKTVFQTDGTSSGARAFRALAKELISILD